MPAKKTLRLTKSSRKTGKASSLRAKEDTQGLVAPSGKIEIATPDAAIQKTAPDSVYVQEAPKEQVLKYGGEQTTAYAFGEKEKLITTFTAGGVVLSFGLSLGSIMIFPVWGYGGGLLATLGIISCFGAFMARETI